VTQPETINYRTYKPEMGDYFVSGFWAVKDWECHCGKIQTYPIQGHHCDRCGVEVTRRKCVRERMGHIELVVPVAHIWYFRSLPNKIGYLLGLPPKSSTRSFTTSATSSFSRYQGRRRREPSRLLTEEEFLDIVDKLHGEPDAGRQ